MAENYKCPTQCIYVMLQKRSPSAQDFPPIYCTCKARHCSRTSRFSKPQSCAKVCRSCSEATQWSSASQGKITVLLTAPSHFTFYSDSHETFYFIYRGQMNEATLKGWASIDDHVTMMRAFFWIAFVFLYQWKLVEHPSSSKSGLFTFVRVCCCSHTA